MRQDVHIIIHVEEWLGLGEGNSDSLWEVNIRGNPLGSQKDNSQIIFYNQSQKSHMIPKVGRGDDLCRSKASGTLRSKQELRVTHGFAVMSKVKILFGFYCEGLWISVSSWDISSSEKEPFVGYTQG